jgi:hypothetical protein
LILGQQAITHNNKGRETAMAKDKEQDKGGNRGKTYDKNHEYIEKPARGGVDKTEKNGIADDFPPPDKKPKK